VPKWTALHSQGKRRVLSAFSLAFLASTLRKYHPKSAENPRKSAKSIVVFTISVPKGEHDARVGRLKGGEGSLEES